MLEWEIIFRLLVSIALGALVGFEREMKHKPAGLRTHMLVSLGACLFTVISIYTFSMDPARVAASIVTGIGFIGAGSIIASRGHVHGVTTAASLWAVAAIGLTVGVGSYLLSIIAAVICFFFIPVLLKIFLPEFLQTFESFKFLLPGLIFMGIALQGITFLSVSKMYKTSSIIKLPSA